MKCDETISLLWSEIPSGMCAKLRTAAASNNRDHASQSHCLLAPHTYIFVLRAHPVCGESHNQRNTTGEVATSHMVTAGRPYFRNRRNAYMTAGKTTMAAGKINYGCFEMLFWPHRTSNYIINICFWLLETCRKYSYFIELNMWPRAQWLAFEVKYEYIMHRSTNISWAGSLRLGKFQITGAWSVKTGLDPSSKVRQRQFSNIWYSSLISD